MKNRKLYYILSYSWGIIMILVGLFVEAYFKICKIPFEKFGPCRVYRYKDHWGGLSLGHTIIVATDASDHTLHHEFGHSIQNAMFGPFFVFLALSSAIRYHYFNFKIRKNAHADLPPYDSFWVEGDATKLGNKYIKYFQ